MIKCSLTLLLCSPTGTPVRPIIPPAIPLPLRRLSIVKVIIMKMLVITLMGNLHLTDLVVRSASRAAHYNRTGIEYANAEGQGVHIAKLDKYGSQGHSS
jgi:hypothetical protein